MKVACRNWTFVAETPCGSVLLDVGERRLDLAREVDRVGAGLLLDRDDHGRLALEAGIAALDARREVHLRDLMQEDGLALLCRPPPCCAGPPAAWSGRRCGSGTRARAGRRSRRRCWCRSA